MLEVGHTHVHGVLGKHLLPLQVGGGWGLEETEKGHVYYTAVAVGCAASAADTGARQKLGEGLRKKEGRSRVGVGPMWS